MSWVRACRAGLAGALLWAIPIIAAAQPVPAKFEYGYRIGPYPVPLEYEGVNAVLYTWLFFTPIVEGRGNPTYSLRVTVKVQLNTLPGMFRQVMRQKYPDDNCGRINNVDNWVYTFEDPKITVVDEHNLRVVASGMVSTWTCLENPVFETVCESYTDSLGISWPYNCKSRPGSPIKTQNIRQGVDVTKGLYLDAKDGAILVKDYEPTINFAGGIADTLLNFIALIEHNLGAAFANAFMSARRIELMVPEAYRAFHPKYDLARFELSNGVPFLAVGASAGVTAKQVNDFMRQTFGGLWTDIPETAAPAAAPALTKAAVQQMCLQQDPADDVPTCAAKMGLPYAELPDQ